MAPAMVKVACFGLAAVLSVCALSNRSKALAQEKGDAYDAFNRFCIENFGAEKEELTYTFAGKELKFIEDGQWVYASERSAAIGFETNLPAKTQIQYGPTRAYGWTTSPPERHLVPLPPPCGGRARQPHHLSPHDLPHEAYARCHPHPRGAPGSALCP